MKETRFTISEPHISNLVQAAHNKSPITGLTHDFYRYPARFSPLFARAAIEAFTNVGDIVYDPFMGGGTTLVEASSLGRKAIGTDINRLAVFVSKVKTTPLRRSQIQFILHWAENIQSEINLHCSSERHSEWIDLGYQRNISGKNTWPIRKTIEMILSRVEYIEDNQIRKFIRCALLSSGQWALDCKTLIPSAKDFRIYFSNLLIQMTDSIKDYRKQAKNQKPKCLHRSAKYIHYYKSFKGTEKPSLILTSPPYPGVHALYHRWQVNGRRETPAPFWIANCLDGQGASYYTLGDRKTPNLKSYFDQIKTIFNSLSKISDSNTLIVQLVAFSAPEWQLPQYLCVMEEAGFNEILIDGYSETPDGRIWRTVPNRKFYADYKGNLAASKEVLLLHRIN